MYLSIVVCDDEAVHRTVICRYISTILSEESYKLVEFSSGEELLINYPEKVDILLLDVQMESLNGLDTARKIREFDTNVAIIFTTAFADFMQQGYEVRAFRYLLKPIGYEEFSKNLLESISEISENHERYLTIKENKMGAIIRIPISSILYIETESRCTLIHTDNQEYKSRTSINSLEKSLEESNFYRCHRSYLINIDKIKSLRKGIVIIKDTEILVSRYKMKNLKLRITDVLGDLLC